MAELERGEVNAMEPPRRQMVSRKSNLGLAIGFLVLVAGTGAFVYWRLQHPVAPAAPPAQAPAAPAPVAAAAPEPAEDALPADAAKVDPEALLRQLATQLSSNADVAAWLKEAKLIPRLTAAVNMVANGENPHPLLGFLAPKGEFAAETRDSKLFTAPAEHARYDAFTRALSSIDPAKCGAAYGQIAPWFQRAFREIGRPGERFTPVLHAAVAKLLATPVPASEPELKEKGAVYSYADDALESLSPAQKQLLRMGPANERAVQAWLEKFERALPR